MVQFDWRGEVVDKPSGDTEGVIADLQMEHEEASDDAQRMDRAREEWLRVAFGLMPLIIVVGVFRHLAWCIVLLVAQTCVGGAYVWCGWRWREAKSRAGLARTRASLLRWDAIMRGERL